MDHRALGNRTSDHILLIARAWNIGSRSPWAVITKCISAAVRHTMYIEVVILYSCPSFIRCSSIINTNLLPMGQEIDHVYVHHLILYIRIWVTICYSTKWYSLQQIWFPCYTSSQRIYQRTSFVPLEYHYRTTIQKTSRKQRASPYLSRTLPYHYFSKWPWWVLLANTSPFSLHYEHVHTFLSKTLQIRWY